MKCGCSGFIFLLLFAFSPTLKIDAASISVNFCIGQNDTNSVDVGETATQFQSVDGTNWNNVLLNATGKCSPTNFINTSTGGNFIRLRGDTGNTNAAQLTSTLPAGGGFCNFSGATPDPYLSSSGEAGMMSSYINIGGNSPAETLTVGGLGASFTANSYKVYLFFDTGTALANVRILG